jgi:hypothetical protein
LFTLSSNTLKGSHTAEIYDLLGQKIMSQQVDPNETVIDLRNYQSGIYLLQISSKGTVVGQTRLVKE